MDWPEVKKLLSERFTVALVEPKYQGNVGAVARIMHNFGFDRLIMVNSNPVDQEALQRAVNSEYILQNAVLMQGFSDLRESSGIIAATSSVQTLSHKKFRRRSMTPDEFWDRMAGKKDQVTLVFGREGDGLYNTEIEVCDYFIHIPANPEYPVLNLSHAVGVVLQKGFQKFFDGQKVETEDINDDNLARLVDGFSRILNLIQYPEYKRKNTEVMIRRMLARASLTQTEFFKLMGILRKTGEDLEKGRNNAF